MGNSSAAEQDIKSALTSIKIEPSDCPVSASIKKMLQSSSPLSSDRCIYRAPVDIRKVNEEAYTPRVVSIGPLHHGRKGFEAMEEQKLFYLRTFLGRTSSSLENYVQVVKSLEDRTRKCYAETIETSAKFTQMILLDGCFIIELFIRNCFGGPYEEGDLLFSPPYMLSNVCIDMMLLENQLPFFVLEGLHNLLSSDKQNRIPTLINLTKMFFEPTIGMTKLLDENGIPPLKHFVDLFWFCQLPTSRPKDYVVTSNCIPCMTQLHQAGVEFERADGDRLFDIDFNNGTLKIPRIVVTDCTEILFRNIIAYEQCNGTNRYVLSYMSFINDLIDTPKDVDMLIHNNILTNGIGSSIEIFILFKAICKETEAGNIPYLHGLRRDLNKYCYTHTWNVTFLMKYCKSTLQRWKETLKRDYFDTPCKGVSVIAASVLLVLTFIQTVYTVLPA